MEAQPIIVATAVEKVYQAGSLQVHALRGIDLSVASGEMLAIMGPSGCGKTTLLNTLSGLDDLSGGQVLIEGAALHEMSDRERTRYRAQRMGFVFQFFNLLPVLSTVENVELPLLVAGVKPSEARRKAQVALDLVGLTGEEHKRPAEISGGQQQRVSVARALVNEPALVWADEPTGSLDSETSAEVMDLLCELNREKGQTFILVTHDQAVASRADRIIRMRSGLIESDDINLARTCGTPHHAAVSGSGLADAVTEAVGPQAVGPQGVGPRGVDAEAADAKPADADSSTQPPSLFGSVGDGRADV